MESHPKIGKDKLGLRFGSIAMRVLMDLLKAMEKGGKGFLGALLESIRKPYK